ncbi:OprD family outer membrane porin [Serpens gallinarum]|jgi:hypothetical protein|uniref:Outer membrane porin, OprD family n=1 Tax=Serpens gallinarum TaxID=2763075 RepID=A0ABR8TIT9_9PSED|nr:OprD family outer membrane porin [Serpens gallinarum]MBD7975692.1 outer membrane porin, OprD family [Serpens gallinarum]
MKKTAVAVAVAVSALGLSQFAAADFVKDSKLSLDLRNYYFNQETDGGAEGGQWGQAFMLNYKSGFTEGAVGVGVDLFGAAAYKLADHGDQQAGMLFERYSADESAERLNKAGATLKARAGKTTAYAGALRPNTPVLVANDARMLPQLFEGVMVTNQDVAGLTLTAAHITKASMRDEDVWTDATDEFGGEFSLAGVDYKIVDGLTAQYYFGQLHNTYKQHFAGLKYAANLGVGKLGADLRYFDTSEDGDGLGRANPRNDNQLWSALVNYSVAGHTFGLGYQDLSGDTGFGQMSNTNYTMSERMIGAGLMTRPDETVMLASYGFDFGTVGIKGLSATVIHQKGDYDLGAAKDRSEKETDVIIGYVVPEGQLKGLGVRLMHGMYSGDDNADIDQTRFIVNYSIPLM